MCEAGRIRHHLKNHLFKASTTVLLVGFQAAGSLGHSCRRRRDRENHGEEIEVRATIRRFEDYSGHADGPELVQWMKERLPIAKTVFLTHGEEAPQVALREAITGIIVSLHGGQGGCARELRTPRARTRRTPAETPAPKRRSPPRPARLRTGGAQAAPAGAPPSWSVTPS